MLDHAWCVTGRFGALARRVTCLTYLFIFSHLNRRILWHSHKNAVFRVTVGQEFQKSRKGERSTSQLYHAVSLDAGTGF